MVALDQNIDSSGWQLTTALTAGDILINGFHPMLTFDNIKAIATDFDSITSITDKEAAFSTWCEKRLKASLKKMVNEWRSIKLKELSARTLIERERLFRPQMHEESKSDFVGDFLGLEIVSTDSMSIAHKVERVGMQLDTDQEITIYLFRSGEREPIQSVNFSYNSSGAVQWVTVDWVLADFGKYYIGYDSNQIAGNYMNTVHYSDHLEIGQGWKVGDHFSVMAFHADVAEYLGDDIGQMTIGGSFIVGGGIVWSANDMTYTSDNNFGLNLEITSFCDYTSLIVGQADSFAYALALRTAIDLLREMIHNPNSNINRNADNATQQRQILMYELDGEPQGRATGLLKDYQNALAGIMFNDSGVDTVCLPCKKKGIKFKVAG